MSSVTDAAAWTLTGAQLREWLGGLLDACAVVPVMDGDALKAFA